MVEIVRRVILTGNGVRNTIVPNLTPKITHWKQIYAHTWVPTLKFITFKRHISYIKSLSKYNSLLRQKSLISKLSWNILYFKQSYSKTFHSKLPISKYIFHLTFFSYWVIHFCSTKNLYFAICPSPLPKSLQFSHKNVEIPFHILTPTAILFYWSSSHFGKYITEWSEKLALL